MRRALPMLIVCLFLAPATAAEIESMDIEYKDGETTLSGYLARPKGVTESRPAVLLVHAWRGHSANVRKKADELAAKGYIAFALDMYGKGVLAKDNGEASKLATPFYQDRSLMRRRARLGLEVLRKQKGVERTRIAAIGFCFGGTTVLELARDGADIAGVVSFHGGLTAGEPAKPDTIKAKVFMATGADDPLVKPEEVVAFWKEMQDANADYQLLVLSDAAHAFTDPGAGPFKRGVMAAYSPLAHERSWKAMDRFFGEIFKK